MTTPDLAMAQKGLWYLASPYSHPDAEMRDRRASAVSRCAGILYEDLGISTFCPIAHSHLIEVEMMAARWGGAPKGPMEFWVPWDEEFFPSMRGAILCHLPGWETSKGMKHERERFAEAGKSLLVIDPQSWFTQEEWEALSDVR